VRSVLGDERDVRKSRYCSERAWKKLIGFGLRASASSRNGADETTWRAVKVSRVPFERSALTVQMARLAS
jgi:hypothetical protein